MRIAEIKEKSTWENFLLNVQEKTFLQSWHWGEFNKMMGNKIWRLGVYDNNELVGAVLAVKITAKRGTFLLIQHGPTGKGLAILLKELRKIARNEKASFIRIAPLLGRNKGNKKLFQDLGFREAPMHANAYEATLKLDVALSEEDLLMAMRKTTRYLVRQASKNPDFEIIKSDKREDVELYDKLNQEVAKYQQFVPSSLSLLLHFHTLYALPLQTARLQYLQLKLLIFLQFQLSPALSLFLFLLPNHM